MRKRQKHVLLSIIAALSIFLGISLGYLIFVMVTGKDAHAQPRRPVARTQTTTTPARVESPGACAPFVNAPPPASADAPQPTLTPADIQALSEDIHHHRRSANSTACAAIAATRLLKERRIPEAHGFINLLADLPQGDIFINCLNHIEAVGQEVWPYSQFDLARHERRQCPESFVGHAIALPLSCGPQMFVQLQWLAHRTFSEVSDRCLDSDPRHPLLQAAQAFQRPEDRPLLEFCLDPQHLPELIGGLPDCILIWNERERIEGRRPTSPLQLDVIRLELRRYLARTHEDREQRYRRAMTPNNASVSRFVPRELEGIAAAGLLRISAEMGVPYPQPAGQEVRNTNFELSTFINDLALVYTEHLFEDDRVIRQTINFDPRPHLGMPDDDDSAARVDNLILNMLPPEDGAHASLLKLKLRWILSRRERLSAQAAIAILHRAYGQFEPQGQTTRHNGLSDDAWLPILREVCETGYNIAVQCRECTGATTLAFQERWRWITERMRLPVPPESHISLTGPRPYAPPPLDPPDAGQR